MVMMIESELHDDILGHGHRSNQFLYHEFGESNYFTTDVSVDDDASHLSIVVIGNPVWWWWWLDK